MTQTVYGIICTPAGLAANRTTAWSTPAEHVRAIQDSQLRVDLNHAGDPVGQVVDLQRRHGSIWCVAEVEDDVVPYVRVVVGDELRHVPHDLFWSASRIGAPEHGGYVFDSVALTPSPARVSARPVTFKQGDVHRAAYRAHDRFEKQLLEQAAEAKLTRHGGPIVIRDNDLHAQLAHRMHPGAFLEAAEDLAWEGRPAGQPLIRPGRIVDVR